MERENTVKLIEKGEVFLGVELGSTRIKAVLTSKGGNIITQSDYSWENSVIDGIFTYDLALVWEGLQSCYADIVKNIKTEYGINLTKIQSMGFSAMMHGYLAFDKDDNLLVPFRTWRNTITAKAAQILSEEFQFNIPQRWSIAHLYQALLNKESHTSQISFITTLAGYVHYKLTGEKVIGIGDASGIFPIDENTLNYNKEMAEKFDKLSAQQGFDKPLFDILPKVLCAGDKGGSLTKEGALLLDPTGVLQEGSVICPPEGDAGTGMTATNSVLPATGNISAGTSVFAMIVLEKSLSKYYPEIDMVTTPSGDPVAMVHCNTCTSDIDGWVKMFLQFAQKLNPNCTIGDVYNLLYSEAVKGDYDCGGLCSINYFAGEPVVGLDEGTPLFIRNPQDKFTLQNFIRSHIYSSFATVKIGLDLLFCQENVKLKKLLGHGGLFKVKNVAQQMMASALNTSVEVMSSAGEGGAWGMAILAEYAVCKEEKQKLSDYLQEVIFKDTPSEKCEPNKEETDGFNSYLEKYKKVLAVEKCAVENL